MYYEINVALNGRHFFATAKRSLESEDQAIELYSLFEEKFPEKDGYSLSLSVKMTSGITYSKNTILKAKRKVK